MPRIKNVDAIFSQIANKAKGSPKSKDTLGIAKKLVGNNLEQIGIGMGVTIPVPEGVEPRNHMAKIRGALMSATFKGQPLEGRKYLSGIGTENDKPVIAVKRLPDTEPKSRAPGGGRPKKGSEGNKEAIAGLDAAKSHLSGAKDGDKAKDAPVAVTGTDNKGKGKTAPVKDLTK